MDIIGLDINKKDTRTTLSMVVMDKENGRINVSSIATMTLNEEIETIAKTLVNTENEDGEDITLIYKNELNQFLYDELQKINGNRIIGVNVNEKEELINKSLLNNINLLNDLGMPLSLKDDWSLDEIKYGSMSIGIINAMRLGNAYLNGIVK